MYTVTVQKLTTGYEVTTQTQVGEYYAERHAAETAGRAAEIVKELLVKAPEEKEKTWVE